MTARAQAVAHVQDLDYGCEEPIEPPSVVAVEQPGETFDDHVKSCEVCRKAKHALGNASTRGLARLNRDDGARRAASWRALCLDGKQFFIESWRAFGLGLPEYAR